MVMAKILVVLFDGGNNVTFHDLHVVDVVEQFQVGVSHFFKQLHAPFGMIALIILVVDFAVEQFHHERYAQFFRLFDDGV